MSKRKSPAGKSPVKQKSPNRPSASAGSREKNMGSEKNPLLWALDVFEKEGPELQSGAHAILRLATRLNRKIQPVYLLSPEQLGLPFDLEASSLKQYQASSEKALNALIARLPEVLRNSGRLGEGVVLVQKRASLSESVKQLSRFAKKVSATAVVVSSHARTGLPRLFLGSFAESLLLANAVPTYIIPRIELKSDAGATHSEDSSSSREPLILFATDLSDKSKKAFGEVLNLAGQMQARIALYHAIQNPAEAVVQSGVFLLGGIWTPVPQFLSEARQKVEKAASSWMALASKKKVSIQLVIDTDATSGPVAGIIQAARSRKAFMIAMAAQSGPVAAVVLGSRTRHVVRESHVPVWVLPTRSTS
jgi:nucleotide-binding universal stress UspA family protein